ncbi:MAG: glycosyltransferase [Verrucomicrobiae bacterium]|nr:glycosyltransferase [Verrucomicrobiae bacterium]
MQEMSDSLSGKMALHLGRYYPPHVGGVEKVMQELCEGLAAFCQVKVMVNQMGCGGGREKINGVEVIRLATLLRVGGAPVGLGWLREMKGIHPDLIHLHHPCPMGVLALLFRKQCEPWICSWHSDIVRQKWLGASFAPFLRMFLSRCKHIVVATPRHVESSSVLRGFREKCVVVPYGMLLTNETPENDGGEAIRLQYGNRLVLAVGRLVYYKGFEYLVEAMKEVDAQCLIIGEGPWRERLERRIGVLGLASRVHLLGQVMDLKPFYRAAEVFVLPSTCSSEAFGMVQLEAMAAGKPIVNTALPTGVPWVSPDGETGLTVPPRDAKALAGAINRLLGEPMLCRRLGAAGRRRVTEKFTQKQMVEGMLKLYADVLGGQKKFGC